MSPMDRLAIAASATLEANLKQSAPPTVMDMEAAPLLHASEKKTNRNLRDLCCLILQQMQMSLLC